MNQANFRRTVRKKNSFQQALVDRGLKETEITEGGRTLKGFQPISNPFPIVVGKDTYVIH